MKIEFKSVSISRCQICHRSIFNKRFLYLSLFKYFFLDVNKILKKVSSE